MEKTVAPANVSPLIKVLLCFFILFYGCLCFINTFLSFRSHRLQPKTYQSESGILPSGARWSLLLAGIFYGNARYNILWRREQKKLEELERTRPEREAKLAEEKQKMTKEQIEDLSRQLGTNI